MTAYGSWKAGIAFQSSPFPKEGRYPVATHGTQIHSFEEAPTPEQERALFSQSEDDVQIRAHRLLIEELARQEGLTVVSFSAARYPT